MSISQNSSRDNGGTTILIKQKKSQKAKIPSILSTKKAFAEAKYFGIHDFINDLANAVDLTFFQSAKGQADYENLILVYYYRFFLILCNFN